jgi:protein-S-isoprenylcysteine O-methyltransferase Ste14
VWLLFRLVGDGTWHAITLKPDWPRAFGLPLFVAATGFTLWARRALGTMWSSAVLVKTGHELRTGGPYAVTRHPIYTGLAGMLAGATLVNGGGRWVVILAAGMAFMASKIRAEERLLSERFPARYEDYRKSVPQLIPRVARPR